MATKHKLTTEAPKPFDPHAPEKPATKTAPATAPTPPARPVAAPAGPKN